MQTITKYLALVALTLNVHIINAQDTIQNTNNQTRIEAFIAFKETIKTQERDFLKAEVEAITIRLEKGEISNSEAEELKMEAAKKRALNIENRLAIVDNKIALLERNDYRIENKMSDYELKEEKQNLFGVNISNKTFNVKTKKTPIKYDIRTSNDFLFAIGFNNAIIEGQSLNDSPYKLGSSGFVELGWNWKTRILKNSPFFRLKYGFSFQWNKFNLEDNKYFQQNGDVTELITFPNDLKKSKFKVTNLVFPVHLELGPLRKLDREDRLRYINNNKFKIGLGGYAGFNIGTRQKLKYSVDGETKKEKQKQSFNTTNLVYGLSGYVGFGDTALYVKYDLSPIFNNQAVDQHNISVGVRFDVD
ncbi:hypothetical protein [Yeosuana marina]|uniref:hypothetical protein n=1 Tax=Yeosuana marina TaxID=1565536 RepID=UPI0030EF333C|tara:strand:+ start:2380 stop:3462 length:1083 start_codon:yes stop_codon:yes gene_type:complete